MSGRSSRALERVVDSLRLWQQLARPSRRGEVDPMRRWRKIVTVLVVLGLASATALAVALQREHALKEFQMLLTAEPELPAV